MAPSRSILTDLAPAQVIQVVEFVETQLHAFLAEAFLDPDENALGIERLSALQQFKRAPAQAPDVLADLLDKVALFLCRVLERRPFFIIDGMHGGILFNNIYSRLADPDREWAGYAGFPVGFEEFDWPEFAMQKIENAIYLARRAGKSITLQVGVSTWEALARYYPAFIQLVKGAYHEGVVELVDGTYAQPHDLVHGLEANLRDFAIGRRVFQHLFDALPAIHVRQELGWHPQTPQVLRAANFKAVALRTRCSGWVSPQPHATMLWRGLDGSCIPALPAHIGIPTGDYGGGQMYAHLGEALARFRESAYPFAAYTNLEDLTDPMPGRTAAYVAHAIEHVFGTYTSYAGLFQATPAPTEEVPVPRDAFGVTWQCRPGGKFWKRKDQYLAIKAPERELLLVEKLNALALACGADAWYEGVLENLWKTYLQALNHDSFTVSWHKTGTYFKARRRRLGSYKGPKAGLRVGAKSLQFIETTRAECARLRDSFFLGVSKVLLADSEPGQAGRAASCLATLLVFNPFSWCDRASVELALGSNVDPLKHVDLATTPFRVRFPGGEEDYPVQYLPPEAAPSPRARLVSARPRLVFAIPATPLGVTRAFLERDEPAIKAGRGAETATPAGAGAGAGAGAEAGVSGTSTSSSSPSAPSSFSWDPETRVFRAPWTELAFRADGSLQRLATRAARAAPYQDCVFLDARAGNHLHYRKPTFELVADGPVLADLVIRGKRLLTRVRLHAHAPRVDFETTTGSRHAVVRWHHPPALREHLTRWVDFPGGKDRTTRENLAALNFVEYRDAASPDAPRLVFMHDGLQNVSFLAEDLKDADVLAKINSTARVAHPVVTCYPLMKKDAYRYAILPLATKEESSRSLDARIAQSVQAFQGTRPALLFPGRVAEHGETPPSLLVLSNPNLLVPAVRPTGRREIEFRVVNPTPEIQGTQLSLPWLAPGTAVSRVDLDGNVIGTIPCEGGGFSLEVPAWRFLTFRGQTG